MTYGLRMALAGALALGVGTGVAWAQEVTLRCQHFLAPEASIPKFFIQPWAEKVEAESNGRIDVQIFPAMQLGGSPPAIYDQIRDGVIDCGWTIPSYTPGRFPEAAAIELPFMMSRDAERSSRAAWEYTRKHAKDRFSDVHLLAAHVHGPGVVHTKGEAVRSAADFEGLKLRGPTRQTNELLERLGATPVGMPVPAFPEALSKGVVDGGVIPWEVVPSLKVEELAHYHTEIGSDRSMYTNFFIWAMNRDSYESLPDDLKKVIDDNSGIETSADAGAAMAKGDRIARKAIAGRDDTTIVEMPEAEVEKIREAGAEVTAAWAERMTGKGLDGQALVDDAKALVAEYDEGS